ALLLLDAVERHAQALDRLRARLRIRAGAPEEVDASDALGRGREPDAQPPVLRFRRRPGVEERAGEPRLLGRADLAHAPALPGRPLEVLEGEIAAVEGVAALGRADPPGPAVLRLVQPGVGRRAAAVV